MAFLLVNSEPGLEDRVVADLRAIKAVREVNLVFGVYDIILQITAPSMDALKSLILNEIRVLPGIRSTLTLLVMEE